MMLQLRAIFPTLPSKKAIYEHTLWESSPLFGFPYRVINRVPTDWTGSMRGKIVQNMVYLRHASHLEFDEEVLPWSKNHGLVMMNLLNTLLLLCTITGLIFSKL